MPDYDVVIVGAGPVGAILALELGAAGAKVLVLEAGPATGSTWAEYEANVDQYRAAGFKVPNSPYYSPPDVPSPSVLDIRNLAPGNIPDDTGYFVQDGPVPFGTDYLRSQGGTMMHWLGTCLRMVPSDFEIASRYGHGVDWPISYDDLVPYYAMAEREFGVSANVADQGYLGIRFPKDYEFPMYRIPPSYLDQSIANVIDGKSVTLDGGSYELMLSSTPQARNSMPNPSYAGGRGYTPIGANGAPHEGLRCEGNSSCIPICPVQAKYTPLKTWARVNENVELRTQCVVSKVIHSGPGPVTALEYIAYTDGPPAPPPEQVTARIFILAGNAIENAKLLLGSEVPNANDLIGRNLMDHPYLLAWALMSHNVGAFRGPSSTSGIEVLRDGAFRSDRAAFRMEVVNWGWDFAAFAPYTNVQQAVGSGLFGAALRQQLADEVPRQFHVGFLYEQLPNPGNRVYVDDSYVDLLGIPRPRIKYYVDDYVRAGMAASRQLWTQLFSMLGAEDHTTYWPTDPMYLTYQGQGYAFHGAGHNVGTHRMGSDASDSVVDSYQRCWEHENVYLVGCGSMPTIATSNPSLTMGALVYRTLDSLRADLGLS
ncbi:MAG: GMC family oxidoreductase [Solirubrobacteraceae bacterium]